jgi:hypothetical protein
MCDPSLSLSKLILQKRHGYRKKIWTHEGPSEKREKKVGHMKVQEKNKNKR